MNVRDLVPWRRNERDQAVATRQESLNPFVSLHSEIDRLFDDVFRSFDAPVWRSPLFGGSSGAGWPAVDVEETDRAYKVTAELPGMNEQDVEVLVRDGVLTIRGERREETQDGARAVRERRYGRFERQLALGDIDEDHVKADFVHGVLTVTLPKSESAIERVKRIPIGNTGTQH